MPSVSEGPFSLLDERLGMPTENYSPRLPEKMEYAGGNEVSLSVTSRALDRLAEFCISAKHVQRITERLGRERADQRDQEVAAFGAGTLQPTHTEPPWVAAIHLDAGKLQLRRDDGRPGVRDRQWNYMNAFVPGDGTGAWGSGPRFNPPNPAGRTAVSPRGTP